MTTLTSEGKGPPPGAAGSTTQFEQCPLCGGVPTGQREVVRAGPVASCGTCGSWYRVPRPTRDDLLKIYDQSYYDAWGLGESESIARSTKRATFAPLVGRLSQLNPARAGQSRNLLDVGAATGLLLEVAAEQGWTPFAVELNPYAAGVLREKFGAQRVFEGELTSCTLPRGSFDAITMTDLIEHVLDVQATLRAAAELLAPGGVLCISTPRIDSLTRRLMRRNWLHFKIEHIQYFSRAGIERALRTAGLSDVQVEGGVKRLTFDYLHHQLRTYPHWLLSPIVHGVHTLLPRALRQQPLPYRCGEMLVFARRGQPRPTAVTGAAAGSA